MRFLIYPNKTNRGAEEFAQQLMQRLSKRGQSCQLMPANGRPEPTDGVLVVGGDGTVLRAVRELWHLHVPFWAVNYGHLGYLTDCDTGDAWHALEQLLAGESRIERRIMLAGTLIHQDQETAFFGLNEAVIHRSGYMRTVLVEPSIGGVVISRFQGDGMIVSTPTGSTAYNLAAGGPMLLPESSHLILTPVCAHSTLCAPMVVPGCSELQLRISMAQNEDDTEHPYLVVDGLQRMVLYSGDVIRCTAGDMVSFVKTEDMSFYRRLQQKMSIER